MSPTIPDLWPPDFGSSQQPSPATILRQQAHLLGQRTQNVVVGEIESKSEGRGRFLHEFHLTAPLLNFRQWLLFVRHGVEFYPAELVILDEDGSNLSTSRVATAEEFMNKLREELATDRIIRLVRSLMDQCRDPEDSELVG